MTLPPKQETELSKLNKIYEQFESGKSYSDSNSEDLVASFLLYPNKFFDVNKEKLDELSEKRRKILSESAGKGAIEIISDQGEILLGSDFYRKDL